jgi:hypothetical protein
MAEVKQKGAELIKNAKHEHFCQLVSNGESAPKAYVLAGYSENGAEQGSSRLLKNVDVCSRVAYLRSVKENHHAEAVKQAIHKSGVGKQWILERLKEVVEIGMAAEPVKDKEGNNTGDYKATNLAAANKALELLGSEEGLFIKRIETGDPGDFDKVGDDELDRSISEANAFIERARNESKVSSAAKGKAKATERKQVK